MKYQMLREIASVSQPIEVFSVIGVTS